MKARGEILDQEAYVHRIFGRFYHGLPFGDSTSMTPVRYPLQMKPESRMMPDEKNGQPDKIVKIRLLVFPGVVKKKFFH